MQKLKHKIHEIVFEADTKAGKVFDVVLLIIISLSIFVVMLESVASINDKYGHILTAIEWTLTILFTIEYVVRAWSVRKPLVYIFSFFGIIDLLSIVPTFLSLLLTGTSGLMIIRMFRLIRVFRVFKLARFVGGGNQIMKALKSSKPKIVVFIGSIVIMVTILGTFMYLIEGEKNGFTSIPKSIYWSIVTLTTVGYGDITPQTGLGQFLASIIMILGYGIIAVPTGIVTSEFVKNEKKTNTQSCINCGLNDHDNDANFCKHCSYKLH